jgi:hypothetical protein
MWLLSSVLIGTLAVYRQDPVFILLQVSTLTSAAIILFLAHKYRGMVCAWHRPLSTDIGVVLGSGNETSLQQPHELGFASTIKLHRPTGGSWL